MQELNKIYHNALIQIIKGALPCGKNYRNPNCYKNCKDEISLNGKDCMYAIAVRALNNASPS